MTVPVSNKEPNVTQEPPKPDGPHKSIVIKLLGYELFLSSTYGEPPKFLKTSIFIKVFINTSEALEYYKSTGISTPIELREIYSYNEPLNLWVDE